MALNLDQLENQISAQLNARGINTTPDPVAVPIRQKSENALLDSLSQNPNYVPSNVDYSQIPGYTSGRAGLEDVKFKVVTADGKTVEKPLTDLMLNDGSLDYLDKALKFSVPLASDPTKYKDIYTSDFKLADISKAKDLFKDTKAEEYLRTDLPQFNGFKIDGDKVVATPFVRPTFGTDEEIARAIVTRKEKEKDLDFTKTTWDKIGLNIISGDNIKDPNQAFKYNSLVDLQGAGIGGFLPFSGTVDNQLALRKASDYFSALRNENGKNITDIYDISDNGRLNYKNPQGWEQWKNNVGNQLGGAIEDKITGAESLPNFARSVIQGNSDLSIQGYIDSTKRLQRVNEQMSTPELVVNKVGGYALDSTGVLVTSIQATTDIMGSAISDFSKAIISDIDKLVGIDKNPALKSNSIFLDYNSDYTDTKQAIKNVGNYRPKDYSNPFSAFMDRPEKISPEASVLSAVVGLLLPLEKIFAGGRTVVKGVDTTLDLARGTTAGSRVLNVADDVAKKGFGSVDDVIRKTLNFGAKEVKDSPDDVLAGGYNLGQLVKSNIDNLGGVGKELLGKTVNLAKELPTSTFNTVRNLSKAGGELIPTVGREIAKQGIYQGIRSKQYATLLSTLSEILDKSIEKNPNNLELKIADKILSAPKDALIGALTAFNDKALRPTGNTLFDLGKGEQSIGKAFSQQLAIGINPELAVRSQQATNELNSLTQLYKQTEQYKGDKNSAEFQKLQTDFVNREESFNKSGIINNIAKSTGSEFLDMAIQSAAPMAMQYLVSAGLQGTGNQLIRNGVGGQAGSLALAKAVSVTDAPRIGGLVYATQAYNQAKDTNKTDTEKLNYVLQYAGMEIAGDKIGDAIFAGVNKKVYEKLITEIPLGQRVTDSLIDFIDKGGSESAIPTLLWKKAIMEKGLAKATTEGLKNDVIKEYVVANIGKRFVSEGISEAGQQVLEDQDKPLTEIVKNAGYAALVGGTLGLFMGGFVNGSTKMLDYSTTLVGEKASGGNFENFNDRYNLNNVNKFIESGINPYLPKDMQIQAVGFNVIANKTKDGSLKIVDQETFANVFDFNQKPNLEDTEISPVLSGTVQDKKNIYSYALIRKDLANYNVAEVKDNYQDNIIIGGNGLESTPGVFDPVAKKFYPLNNQNQNPENKSTPATASINPVAGIPVTEENTISQKPETKSTPKIPVIVRVNPNLIVKNGNVVFNIPNNTEQNYQERIETLDLVRKNEQFAYTQKEYDNAITLALDYKIKSENYNYKDGQYAVNSQEKLVKIIKNPDLRGQEFNKKNSVKYEWFSILGNDKNPDGINYVAKKSNLRPAIKQEVEQYFIEGKLYINKINKDEQGKVTGIKKVTEEDWNKITEKMRLADENKAKEKLEREKIGQITKVEIQLKNKIAKDIYSIDTNNLQLPINNEYGQVLQEFIQKQIVLGDRNSNKALDLYKSPARLPNGNFGNFRQLTDRISTDSLYYENKAWRKVKQGEQSNADRLQKQFLSEDWTSLSREDFVSKIVEFGELANTDIEKEIDIFYNFDSNFKTKYDKHLEEAKKFNKDEKIGIELHQPVLKSKVEAIDPFIAEPITEQNEKELVLSILLEKDVVGNIYQGNSIEEIVNSFIDTLKNVDINQDTIDSEATKIALLKDTLKQSGITNKDIKEYLTKELNFAKDRVNGRVGLTNTEDTILDKLFTPEKQVKEVVKEDKQTSLSFEQGFATELQPKLGETFNQIATEKGVTPDFNPQDDLEGNLLNIPINNTETQTEKQKPDTLEELKAEADNIRAKINAVRKTLTAEYREKLQGLNETEAKELREIYEKRYKKEVPNIKDIEKQIEDFKINERVDKTTSDTVKRLIKESYRQNTYNPQDTGYYIDLTLENIKNVTPLKGIDVLDGRGKLPTFVSVKTKDGKELVEIKDWSDAKQGFRITGEYNSEIARFRTIEEAVNFSKKALTIVSEASRQGKRVILYGSKVPLSGMFFLDETPQENITGELLEPTQKKQSIAKASALPLVATGIASQLREQFGNNDLQNIANSTGDFFAKYSDLMYSPNKIVAYASTIGADIGLPILSFGTYSGIWNKLQEKGLIARTGLLRIGGVTQSAFDRNSYNNQVETELQKVNIAINNFDSEINKNLTIAEVLRSETPQQERLFNDLNNVQDKLNQSGKVVSGFDKTVKPIQKAITEADKLVFDTRKSTKLKTKDGKDFPLELLFAGAGLDTDNKFSFEGQNIDTFGKKSQLQDNISNPAYLLNDLVFDNQNGYDVNITIPKSLINANLENKRAIMEQIVKGEINLSQNGKKLTEKESQAFIRNNTLTVKLETRGNKEGYYISGAVYKFKEQLDELKGNKLWIPNPENPKQKIYEYFLKKSQKEDIDKIINSNEYLESFNRGNDLELNFAPNTLTSEFFGKLGYDISANSSETINARATNANPMQSLLDVDSYKKAKEFLDKCNKIANIDKLDLSNLISKQINLFVQNKKGLTAEALRRNKPYLLSLQGAFDDKVQNFDYLNEDKNEISSKKQVGAGQSVVSKIRDYEKNSRAQNIQSNQDKGGFNRMLHSTFTNAVQSVDEYKTALALSQSSNILSSKEYDNIPKNREKNYEEIKVTVPIEIANNKAQSLEYILAKYTNPTLKDGGNTIEKTYFIPREIGLSYPILFPYSKGSIAILNNIFKVLNNNPLAIAIKAGIQNRLARQFLTRYTYAVRIIGEPLKGIRKFLIASYQRIRAGEGIELRKSNPNLVVLIEQDLVGKVKQSRMISTKRIGDNSKPTTGQINKLFNYVANSLLTERTGQKMFVEQGKLKLLKQTLNKINSVARFGNKITPQLIGQLSTDILIAIPNFGYNQFVDPILGSYSSWASKNKKEINQKTLEEYMQTNDYLLDRALVLEANGFEGQSTAQQVFSNFASVDPSLRSNQYLFSLIRTHQNLSNSMGLTGKVLSGKASKSEFDVWFTQVPLYFVSSAIISAIIKSIYDKAIEELLALLDKLEGGTQIYQDTVADLQKVQFQKQNLADSSGLANFGLGLVLDLFGAGELPIFKDIANIGEKTPEQIFNELKVKQKDRTVLEDIEKQQKIGRAATPKLSPYDILPRVANTINLTLQVAGIIPSDRKKTVDVNGIKTEVQQSFGDYLIRGVNEAELQSRLAKETKRLNENKATYTTQKVQEINNAIANQGNTEIARKEGLEKLNTLRVQVGDEEINKSTQALGLQDINKIGTVNLTKNRSSTIENPSYKQKEAKTTSDIQTSYANKVAGVKSNSSSSGGSSRSLGSSGGISRLRNRSRTIKLKSTRIKKIKIGKVKKIRVKTTKPEAIKIKRLKIKRVTV